MLYSTPFWKIFEVCPPRKKYCMFWEFIPNSLIGTITVVINWTWNVLTINMPQNGRLGICDVCVNLFLVDEGVLVKPIFYILRANLINCVSRRLLGIIDFLVGTNSSTNNHLWVIIQFTMFSSISLWCVYIYIYMNAWYLCSTTILVSKNGGYQNCNTI